MATPRVTVLQPDPEVPVDRFGPWLGGNRLHVRTVGLWREELPSVSEIGDGLVVLGGITSAHSDDPWIGPLKEVLVEAVENDIPTLAICLGHQLLAEAFGGRVRVADPAGGEHGTAVLTWTAAAHSDPLLGRLTHHGSAIVAESHNDIVTALPPGAIELAATDKYPNQAFRIGSAVGVQFHPEASPRQMGRWAEIEGGSADAMRREMWALDAEVTKTGLLLSQSFAEQLHAPVRAA